MRWMDRGIIKLCEILCNSNPPSDCLADTRISCVDFFSRTAAPAGNV